MRERPETGTGTGARGKCGAAGRSYDPDRLFLHPDDDLAPNRPGETLRAGLDASRAGRWSLLFARLLGRRPVEDAWRRALAAEQLVGAALEVLTPGGWEVLHSVALPGDAVVSHLLIGPGGVFCVHVEPVRRGLVRADDECVRVPGERHPRPVVRRVRQNAARCAPALARGCGFSVRVRGVVVLVGATEIDAGDGDVRVVTEHQVAGLGALGGVLRPERVDRVHTVARNRRVWLGC
ncbi:NERD domain-containing protein [Streptomyces sp. AV19]|uniref:nuclease-related domain-containing protein n=1 Tax=Streptomyces sp. AV19 TaxID=2793068 RepID=UPI0018FE3746|nr:nuclease-related domain-containing protein [Streptomyces sp. AV19]MBH1938461.1 NERD domain-containing protein [Streptomyces sp. AV19]MDG4535109.1 NERD domain-containing protein [Streptomyces sp. AV19]